MRHVTKAGQPANSNERGGGLVVHAVDSECSVFGLKQPAICGDTPSGRLGWSDWLTLAPASPVPPITCPNCLKVLPEVKQDA